MAPRTAEHTEPDYRGLRDSFTVADERESSVLRRLVWLAEDLAAFGSTPDGFEFEGFNDLTARARGCVRIALGREDVEGFGEIEDVRGVR